MSPVAWGEAEIRGPVHLFRERLVLARFRRLVARGTVLDAGCGSGSLALTLARAGYQVRAIDAAEAFVARLRQQAEVGGLSARLEVRAGSVTALPWPAASCAGVVCAEVLEHLGPEVGGDVAAVGEFWRILAPGGACVVSVPLGPGLWDESDTWAGHVKRYRRDQLTELFSGAGFRVDGTASWGFPLGRLYHRWVFLPWVRRTAGQAVAVREARWYTRAGRHPLVSGGLALGLRLDALFSRWPWGRGMVLWAHRP